MSCLRSSIVKPHECCHVGALRRFHASTYFVFSARLRIACCITSWKGVDIQNAEGIGPGSPRMWRELMYVRKELIHVCYRDLNELLTYSCKALCQDSINLKHVPVQIFAFDRSLLWVLDMFVRNVDFVVLCRCYCLLLTLFCIFLKDVQTYRCCMFFVVPLCTSQNASRFNTYECLCCAHATIHHMRLRRVWCYRCRPEDALAELPPGQLLESRRRGHHRRAQTPRKDSPVGAPALEVCAAGARCHRQEEVRRRSCSDARWLSQRRGDAPQAASLCPPRIGCRYACRHTHSSCQWQPRNARRV